MKNSIKIIALIFSIIALNIQAFSQQTDKSIPPPIRTIPPPTKNGVEVSAKTIDNNTTLSNSRAGAGSFWGEIKFGYGRNCTPGIGICGIRPLGDEELLRINSMTDLEKTTSKNKRSAIAKITKKGDALDFEIISIDPETANQQFSSGEFGLKEDLLLSKEVSGILTNDGKELALSMIPPKKPNVPMYPMPKSFAALSKNVPPINLNIKEVTIIKITINLRL